METRETQGAVALQLSVRCTGPGVRDTASDRHHAATSARARTAAGVRCPSRSMSHQRLGVSAIDQETGLAVAHHLRDATHAGSDHRVAICHRIGDHPSEHFFPAKGLAENAAAS
jgi:hypothetical protein